jgi:hypothetical protein
MKTITLNRTNKSGKAVNGVLRFTMLGRDQEEMPVEVPTLENADFIIPPGTYTVKQTWSPRFKKFLPEVLEVPERTGIRIHRGSIPEHSKGCILTDMNGMSSLDVMFNQENKFYDNEEVTLCIIDAFDADNRSAL